VAFRLRQAAEAVAGHGVETLFLHESVHLRRERPDLAAARLRLPQGLDDPVQCLFRVACGIDDRQHVAARIEFFNDGFV